MNFRPELASKVMAGEKTVTRRQMSDNPRSPWCILGCSLKVGQSYAVCPGRGKKAIGRVVVTDVRRSILGDVDATEARREGFRSILAFREAWTLINDGIDPYEEVWRVTFKVDTDAYSTATTPGG